MFDHVQTTVSPGCTLNVAVAPETVERSSNGPASRSVQSIPKSDHPVDNDVSVHAYLPAATVIAVDCATPSGVPLVVRDTLPPGPEKPKVPVPPYEIVRRMIVPIAGGAADVVGGGGGGGGGVVSGGGGVTGNLGVVVAVGRVVVVGGGGGVVVVGGIVVVVAESAMACDASRISWAQVSSRACCNPSAGTSMS